MSDVLRTVLPVSESTESERADREEPAAETDDESGAKAGSGGPLFLLARLLFGGVLAFMGLNHFLNPESMIGYAESKGVPNASLAVPFSGGMLVFGGLGIALWRLPTLAAGAVATFFVGVTPKMHDFWNYEGEEKQDQQIQFMKNLGLLGGALAFLVRAGRE
ncbi:DoxX family protein [Halegenticoccus soli]|uniref:DoxX family protein n=1 Tax=Halegenticoccus soli TaxID=1985678 RepID=UPI000C6C912E|nr:DoxX family protein [Halegenticoccus soli]